LKAALNGCDIGAKNVFKYRRSGRSTWSRRNILGFGFPGCGWGLRSHWSNFYKAKTQVHQSLDCYPILVESSCQSNTIGEYDAWWTFRFEIHSFWCLLCIWSQCWCKAILHRVNGYVVCIYRWRWSHSLVSYCVFNIPCWGDKWFLLILPSGFSTLRNRGVITLSDKSWYNWLDLPSDGSFVTTSTLAIAKMPVPTVLTVLSRKLRSIPIKR